ncbi:membrane protein [Agromyces tropicus]|uniref:Membrane protein n=1 Tax=Agromyces tropicus TaxID=555371 RepID=A0ABP5FW92_9MICO
MSDANVTGWVGWGWFAGVMLILVGVIDAIRGFIAILLPDNTYFLKPSSGQLLILDAAGWGWVHLLVGAGLVIVGIALLGGAAWAQVIAIVLAAFSALANLMVLPLQPWWSAIVIAVDVLVIYALTVHGKELARAR